jgi:Type IV secretion system pilin
MNKKVIKIILTSLVFIFIFNVNFAFAGIEESNCKPGMFKDLGENGNICYQSEVKIPGLPDKFEIKSTTLGFYIKVIYEYLLYVAGVLAVIVIMVGGFQWVAAGGNQSKIGEAKERIIGAIIGLFLALGSYLLLFTVNPDLVKIHDLNMPDIRPISFYCMEGQTVREVGNNGAYSIKGEEAKCGGEFEYKIDDSDFKCKGIACTDSKDACYEEDCFSMGDVCLKIALEEFDSKNKTLWSGEVKGGWDGEVSLADHTHHPIKGVCFKWTIYKSGISTGLLETRDIYYYGFAYDDDVSDYIDSIADDHSQCNNMNVKKADQYLACRKSSFCSFSVSDNLVNTKCIPN